MVVPRKLADMEKLLYYLSIASAMVALTSCSSGHGSSVKNEDAGTEHQDGYTTVLQFDPSQYVVDVAVNDGRLIALTSSSPFITTFDLETWQIKDSYGTIGRSGNEYSTPPRSLNIRMGEVQFYDSNSKTMNSFSLSNWEKTSKAIPYSTDFRTSKMISIDEVKLAVGYFSSGRLGMIDKDGKITTDFEYPFPTGEVQGLFRGNVFQADIHVAPTRPSFVVRSLASDSFEIYEVDGSSVRRVFASECKNPPVAKQFGSQYNIDFKQCIAGFSRCYVTDSSIFMLWSDEQYDTASKKGLVSDIIIEFDWNGNRMHEYHLPCEVGAFCINDRTLYGVSEHESGYCLNAIPL